MATQATTVPQFVLAHPDASIVMVHRHASYLMGPLLARCPDEMEAYARNYAELEHPTMFLLDKAGIELSWQQGWTFAEAGVEIVEIIGSEQGRGPDTGLRLSEGYHMASGRWVPFRCHRMANYPVYEYEVVLRCLREVGDAFVAQWLNGKHPGLVRSDTPKIFQGRVIGLVQELLASPGLKVVATHFELALLAHNVYVEHIGVGIGTIREDWFPTKSGGVLIMEEDGDAQAFDYTPDLTIVNTS